MRKTHPVVAEAAEYQLCCGQTHKRVKQLLKETEL